MIVIEESKVINQTGSANTSLTLDTTPDNGNLMFAQGGHFYNSGSDTLTLSTPASSYTERTSSTASFRFMVKGWSDTFNSDGATVTITKDGAVNDGGSLFVVEMSGASGFDVASSVAPAAATSCAIPVTAAVATNGSLAFAVFHRDSTSEALGTPAYAKTGTAAGSWSELTKIQVNGTSIEIYVATMTVNAGETVGCTLSGMTSARGIGGSILIATPTVNTNPTITVPGAQRYVIGVAEVIAGLSCTDPDGGDVDVLFTCTKGTFAAPTPTNVDVSGSGTSAMTLTGTPTELNAYFGAGNGPTYTHSTANADADTITVNVDDNIGTPDEDTIAVTAIDFRVTADTMPDLNNTLANLLVTGTAVGSTTLNLYTVDSGNRTGTRSTQAVVSLPSTTVQGSSGIMLGLTLSI